MLTIRCDDHGLPIIIEIHLEATEVKNHLKLFAFLNVSKFYFEKQRIQVQCIFFLLLLLFCCFYFSFQE